MKKMMKVVGGMITMTMAGYGAYEMMKQKMPKSKMKKTMKSPYTMNQNSNVKSN